MKPIAITPATQALDAHGIKYSLHKFSSSASRDFGMEAARNLDVDPTQIFKTILFRDSHCFYVGVSPVTWEINGKKVANAVGVRHVEPASVQDAQRVTGYVVGGISPFGQRKKHPTILDDSASRFPTIFVSGGRRGLEIEIAPDDLVSALQATVAQISAQGFARH